MKCQDLLKALGDYVDGGLEPGVCEEFETHMQGCHACQVVVDNVRRTITVYREGAPVELPVAFRERLHASLADKWKERAGGG